MRASATLHRWCVDRSAQVRSFLRNGPTGLGPTIVVLLFCTFVILPWLARERSGAASPFGPCYNLSRPEAGPYFTSVQTSRRQLSWARRRRHVPLARGPTASFITRLSTTSRRGGLSLSDRLQTAHPMSMMRTAHLRVPLHRASTVYG